VTETRKQRLNVLYFRYRPSTEIIDLGCKCEHRFPGDRTPINLLPATRPARWSHSRLSNVLAISCAREMGSGNGGFHNNCLILLVNDRQLSVASHSLARANIRSLDRLGGSKNRPHFRQKPKSLVARPTNSAKQPPLALPDDSSASVPSLRISGRRLGTTSHAVYGSRLEHRGRTGKASPWNMPAGGRIADR
jgi:hypothetical protein